MANELIYSADKERLLEELKSASVSSTRLPEQKNPEHVEALHDLFGQVVGLPKEAEPEVKPKSPRMTHNELKAMKVVSSKLQDPKVSVMQRVSQSLIQMWCAVQSLFAFTPRKTNALTCVQNGHECSHCGTKIPYESKR